MDALACAQAVTRKRAPAMPFAPGLAIGARTWIDRIAAGLIGTLGLTLILRH